MMVEESKLPLSSEPENHQLKTWLVIACVLCGIVVCIVLISSSKDLGRANNKKTNKTPDGIIGKIYVCNNIMNNDLPFEFLAFYDDNTLRGVHYTWSYNKISDKRTDSYSTTYGTYIIDKNALTINVANDSYACVIIDNGKRIMIGDIEWADSSNGTYSKDFLKAIGQ